MYNILVDGLNEIGLTSESAENLEKFADMLLETNKVMNLTAITEPFDVATKHMLDCAMLAKYFDFNDKKVIDVGCGAGFPGFPLKLCVPNMEITLLDSLRKRIDFLNDCIVKLNLDKISAVHARAEEIKDRESYDFALSRAVAPLNVLSELCLPYVKVGGKFIAMKSVNCDDEVKEAENAIKLLGGKVENVIDYTLPKTDVIHRLVIISKVKETNKKYPRRFNKISANPL